MVKIKLKFPENKVKELYLDGYEREILDGFKLAVRKYNTSVVCIVDGRSGMGKTTKAMQQGIYLDPNFNLKKVFFDPKTFLEGLANAKPGDFILFDEAMLISSRASLSEMNRMIIIAMSMIRSKKIFVYFCVNSIFDIDRNLVLSRADCLFHIYGQSLIDRGRFSAFFKSKGDGIDRLKDLYLNGKKYYSYSRPKANFIGSFTKEFVVNEPEYERLKQIGVNNFLRGTEPQLTRAGRCRNKLIVLLHTKYNLKTSELAQIIDLDVRSIQRIIRESQENDKNETQI